MAARRPVRNVLRILELSNVGGQGPAPEDETFRAWRESYAYDLTALDARMESANDKPEYYREDRVSIRAAYEGERVPIALFPDGVDPIHFAPRIKIPTLLVEARDDFTYPYVTSQLPYFRLLGAPEKDKKMVLRDGGHIAVFPPETFREILNWLDRYLGPVT